MNTLNAVLSIAGGLIVLGGFMYGAATLAARPVRAGIAEAQRQAAGLTGFANVLVGLLADAGVLSAGAVVKLAQSYNALWSAEVARERQSLNPLTQDEVDRFESLRVKLMDEHKMLTPEEVRDYQALTDKLYADRPRDPNLPLLIGLGLLLAALVFGGSKGRPEVDADKTPTGKPSG